MRKASFILSFLLALVVLSMWVPEADAYEDYQGCSSCHPGFEGGRNDVTHSLHTGGESPITTNCDLCHTGSGRSNPLTLWSTYNGGNGYGCAGCHGRDYGETIGADYSGFPIAGLPKASTWGLRRFHERAGITECLDCHGDQEPLPENEQPPYYADPNSENNVTDPCADNLDNDGDGIRDADDPDCTESVCGDGTVDPDEQCDDGAANGSTSCGCQNDCSLPSAGTPCADGEFCNGDETCNGAGDCQSGIPVDCNDGVGCTDDSCDEGSDSCENTPNDGNCPDDGQFCTGSEFCDAVNDCSSTGDPCGAGESCNDETNTCDPQAECGDGTVDPGEQCDDGAANGSTSCGCQTDCTLPSAGTSCADGEFCNGDETCNGAGACQAGIPVDCDDGVGCTDDSCDEGSDSCENTPNDGNCPDDGQFCTGSEFCDAVNDCSSTGDPCSTGDTCDEDTDVCVAPPVVIDLDIVRFSVTKSIRLARVKPVTIKLVVKNNGTANAQTRPATVIGWQNGGEVYTETQQVSAGAGKGRSTFNFGPYTPTAPGEIMWTVIISDDDPDDDTATAFTSVK